MKRKGYYLELKNNKLKVSKSENQEIWFFHSETDEISVASKGFYLILKVCSCSKVFYFEPTEERAKGNIEGDWFSLINKMVGITKGNKCTSIICRQKIQVFIGKTQFA